MAMLSARGLMDRGRPAEAARMLVRAVETARSAHNTWQQARVLLVLSGCRIMLFDYRGAMQTAESARRLALRANDNTTAGSAAINLATLYLQLGDVRLAAREASYAADLLRNSDRKRRLAQALLIYANVNAERIRIRLESPPSSGVRLGADQAKKQIESDYHRGIEVTHAAGLTHLEANFWEELGYSLLLAHLPAEEPLKKAYALEAASHDQDALAVNRSHQAEWEFRQGNYPLALRLIDQAFASRSSQFRRTPQFYPLHLRGVLLQKLNRESEALAELRRAADAASAWREGALPGDATSTRTVVVLNEVYQDYAQLAAQVALRTGNNSLAREALEVLAENRAANLREEITVSYSRKQRLPQRYFDLLSDLQSTQSRLVLGVSDSNDNVKLEQVRLELGNLENELGASQHSVLQNVERNSHRNSLRDIQARLSSREVLLSFDLGKQNSFLWTVTADRVSLYKLAGESEIAHAARDFSQAVQRHRDGSDEGLRLSRLLFSNLPADLSRKPDWLIVADGVLLEDVPFSALPDLSKPKACTFSPNLTIFAFFRVNSCCFLSIRLEHSQDFLEWVTRFTIWRIPGACARWGWRRQTAPRTPWPGWSAATAKYGTRPVRAVCSKQKFWMGSRQPSPSCNKQSPAARRSYISRFMSFRPTLEVNPAVMSRRLLH